jgi:hypothetical protein
LVTVWYSILGIRNVIEALELKTLNECYGDISTIEILVRPRLLP